VIHVNNTINGIHTIRAARLEKMAKEDFQAYSDDHTTLKHTFVTLERWFGQKLDIMIVLYLISAIFSLIFTKDTLKLDSVLVGVALVQILQFFGRFFLRFLFS
jgi:ABC-type multidrug transport system fused ATPase/permease subunit